MIVYWTMLIVVCAGGWYAEARPAMVSLDGQARFYPNRSGVLVALAALVAVSGLRSGTHDTAAYIQVFNVLVPSDLSEIGAYLLRGKESGRGFFLYQSLIKCFFSQDFHFFLFTTALLSNFFIIATLYSFSPSLLMSFYLYITMGTYSWTMNGIRQFLAASAMFYCLRWIIDGRWQWYFIVVAVMSTVHFSALIMLPLYFIVREKPWSRTCWAVIALMLLATFYFSSTLSVFFDALEGSEFSNYRGAIEEVKATNILRALMTLVPVIMAYLQRKRISLLNNRLLDVCVNFSIVNFLLMLFATRGGGIFFGRLCGFTELPNLILCPMLIKLLPLEQMYRNILTMGLAGLYFYYYYYQMVVTWHSYYVSDILFGSAIIR